MNSALQESAYELKVGLIGMGLVGQALIERLLAAGHQVIGFDVDQASRNSAAGKGVEIAPNAQAVAMECEIVFLSLPNHDIVQSVMVLHRLSKRLPQDSMQRVFIGWTRPFLEAAISCIAVK
jgi:3-hydroxyisobutyrate dehydrogenase-like beta-hydroxyacid dehydrogenase